MEKAFFKNNYEIEKLGKDDLTSKMLEVVNAKIKGLEMEVGPGLTGGGGKKVVRKLEGEICGLKEECGGKDLVVKDNCKQIGLLNDRIGVLDGKCLRLQKKCESLSQQNTELRGSGIDDDGGKISNPPTADGFQDKYEQLARDNAILYDNFKRFRERQNSKTKDLELQISELGIKNSDLQTENSSLVAQ